MDKKDTIQKTGGQFILDPINNTSIFTREDFTSEHSEIHKMVMDFDKERVLSQKEKIEKFKHINYQNVSSLNMKIVK